MRFAIIAATLIGAYLFAIYSTRARAQESEYPGYYCGSHDCRLHVDSSPIPMSTPEVPAWAKAYHICGTFGATADDCDPPKIGELYAFCNAEWKEVCNQKVLMLKDTCEQTVEMYGGGDSRFSCAAVDDATRDAYMRTVDRDVYERTVEAWAAGR